MFDLGNGFVRIHSPPRKARAGTYISRDGSFCYYPLTPQQQWLHDRSQERYYARPDAIQQIPIMSGEIGHWEGVRFIESSRL